MLIKMTPPTINSEKVALNLAKLATRVYALEHMLDAKKIKALEEVAEMVNLYEKDNKQSPVILALETVAKRLKDEHAENIRT